MKPPCPICPVSDPNLNLAFFLLSHRLQTRSIRFFSVICWGVTFAVNWAHISAQILWQYWHRSPIILGRDWSGIPWNRPVLNQDRTSEQDSDTFVRDIGRLGDQPDKIARLHGKLWLQRATVSYIFARFVPRKLSLHPWRTAPARSSILFSCRDRTCLLLASSIVCLFGCLSDWFV